MYIYIYIYYIYIYIIYIYYINLSSINRNLRNFIELLTVMFGLMHGF